MQMQRLNVIYNHIVPSNRVHSIFENSTLTPNETCGIIAYVGKEEAWGILVDGLSILENRGYDSAGVCTLDSKNQLTISKFASSQHHPDAINR
jgi:hypothetical protein